MKYLSFISDDMILDQYPLPESWTEQQIEELDKFLRANKVLTEEQEIIVTETV
jgi:hypothetical protein